MKKALVSTAVLLFLIYCGKGRARKIEATGIVDGSIITLKSQVTGTVEEMAVKEGERLEKGSLITRINSEKVENELKGLDISQRELDINRQKAIKQSVLLEENIKYLKKQVERFRRLKQSQSLPGEKLENMELKLLEAETSLFDLGKSLESLEAQKERIQNKRDYLELVLNDHTIEAPVKGVVLEKFVSPGENVFPNTAVVDILDTDSLYVEVFIEGVEISGLKLNQRAAIIMDGMPGREFSGVVSFFGKKAEFSPKYIISEKERQSLLYRVKVKINEEIDRFKVGMPVTVVFKAGDGQK